MSANAAQWMVDNDNFYRDQQKIISNARDKNKIDSSVVTFLF